MRRQTLFFKFGMSLLIVGLVFGFAACSQQESDTSKTVAAKDEKAINPVVFELVMNELVRSSEKWNGLDPNMKQRAIEGFLVLMRNRENARISKPADYYTARLDEMLAQNPNSQQNIPTILKVITIMDYDFDNGQDKDRLALEYLGPKLYEANKARLAALAQQKQ
jgi:hypothetical protein